MHGRGGLCELLLLSPSKNKINSEQKQCKEYYRADGGSGNSTFGETGSMRVVRSR